jgi:dTDP-4-dehydrorhamnose 3,5-epimerase
MEFITTSHPEVFIIKPKVFGDNRGWFMESWSETILQKNGINCHFVQDNHSFTVKNDTLRGLHFQNNPMSQSKLVRVIRGSVFDVAVDIRKGSPYYLKWVSAILSAENMNQLFIPKGFAHGFLTLTDSVEFVYKVDNYYSPECDRSIIYSDPEIGIEWNVLSPIMSEKDLAAPLLHDSDCNYIFGVHI